MARILVTRQLPVGGLDPLADAGHEIVQRADDTPFTPEELRAAVADVDAVLCLLTDRIDAALLDAATAGGHVKVVANVAVGYDNIDVARRGRPRHRGVQHARRARRDDGRPRVPPDPRRVPARVRGRARPARRPLARLGDHAVPGAGRPRRHAGRGRVRPHREGSGAAGRRLRDGGPAPHPHRHRDARMDGRPRRAAAGVGHRVTARSLRPETTALDRRPAARAS